MKITQNRVTKIFLILTFNVLTLLAFNFRVNAAVVSKQHSRVFTIQDDHVHIKETKTSRVVEQGFQISAGSTDGFTVFTPIAGDPDFDEKLQKTIDSVNVVNSFGQRVVHELNETSSGNYEVIIKNPNSVTFGNVYSVTLEYESYGLLINTGAIKDLFVPGFPEDYSFENESYTESVTTDIIIPNKYSDINFISPDQNIIANGENRVINIPTTDLLGNSAWVQIGTEQYFEFEIRQTLPKTSSIPFAINTFKLPVPRDIKSGPITQKVYFSEISPEPYSAEEDEDGNLILTFKESGAKDLNIYIKGYASLSQSPDYSFKNAGKLSDIGTNLEKYLEGANYWEVEDTQIQTTANEIRSGKDDIFQIISDTYEFVIDRIDYSFVKKNGLNDRQGALKTLSGGAAVCMEYSDLFITLLRAQGVPARAAFGYGYGTSDFDARQDNTINHQWAEVYIPEQDAWVAIDTTWGEFGSDLIGGDLNHFYSHVASVDPETPSTSSASFFGSLDEIPERNMEIFMVEDLPDEAAIDQSGVLEKYPIVDSSSELIANLRIQNGIVDNLISQIIKNDSPLAINAIKVLIITSPILLIILIVTFRRNRKKKGRATQDHVKNVEFIDPLNSSKF